MKELSEKEIDRLSRLARIRVEGEDRDKLQQNLARVLGHIEKLQSVNTEGVPPTVHVHTYDDNVYRADEVDSDLSTEAFLRNAPDNVGTMIKTPSVLQEKG